LTALRYQDDDIHYSIVAHTLSLCRGSDLLMSTTPFCPVQSSTILRPKACVDGGVDGGSGASFRGPRNRDYFEGRQEFQSINAKLMSH